MFFADVSANSSDDNEKLSQPRPRGRPRKPDVTQTNLSNVIPNEGIKKIPRPRGRPKKHVVNTCTDEDVIGLSSSIGNENTSFGTPPNFNFNVEKCKILFIMN